MEKEKHGKAMRKGTVAVYTDTSIIVGGAIDFGKDGIGKEEENALFDALQGVENEDDLFFALVEAADGKSAPDAGNVKYVSAEHSAFERAPLGFFDMTARKKPFPATGYVVAKNVSSRDAIIVAENEEGDVVAREWPRGSSVELRDGKIEGRREASAPGTTPVHLLCSYVATASYVADDGSRKLLARNDMALTTSVLRMIEEKDFPLAFTAEEMFGERTLKREIHAWNGKFWSETPAHVPPTGRETLAQYEAKLRREGVARLRKLAKGKGEAYAVAFALDAKRAKKPISVEVGDSKEQSVSYAKTLFECGRQEKTVACGGTVWHQVGEPRYMALANRNKTYVGLALFAEPRTSDAEEFPATMTKEEVVRFLEEKRGTPTASIVDWGRVTSATVVDPKFVTIPVPKA